MQMRTSTHRPHAWTPRRIAGVAAGLAVALAAVVIFRDVFVLMALALVIAASVAPLSGWLERRGLPHAAAVTVAMGAVVAAIAATVAFLVPQFAAQASRFGQDLPQLADKLVAMEERWFGGALGLEAQDLTAWLRARGEALAQHATTGALMIAKTTVGLLATLFVGYYFLLDRHRLADQAASLLPPGGRERAREVGHQVFHEVGRYMIGRLIIMAVVGVVTGLGLWAVGVPYPAVLGLVAGLMDIVPFVGPLVAAGLGILVALGDSPQTAMMAAGVYLAVQGVENYFLQPVVFGRAVGVHPIWIFLALVAGDRVLGMIGLLLAVPAAVVVHVVLARVYQPAITKTRPDPRAAVAFEAVEGVPPAVRLAPPPLHVTWLEGEAPAPGSAAGAPPAPPGTSGS